MRRFVVFVLALAPTACGPTLKVVPPAKVASAPPAKVEPTPVPRARATRCVAEPATVYGQEDVAFRVEGEGVANGTVDVELRDERGRSVSKGSVTVPGELRLPDVPSGDFLLIVGSGRGRAGAPRLLSCAVTVNRDLARASSAVR